MAAAWPPLAGWREGAEVTVTDLSTADSLAGSIAQLADVPIAHWTLGRHDEADFAAADAIIANPAVRPTSRCWQRLAGAACRSLRKSSFFWRRCGASVIVVTGSNGKSTTASMLSDIFARAGGRAWLGGNIGVSLLVRLPEIHPGDRVVLEVSSFQLAHLSAAVRPPLGAVITNCTPNHLDWHGSWDAYVAAKRRALEMLPTGGFAVVDPTDAR